MTGRELIIYILTNGLEDEQVFVNGRFVGFMTIGEAASKLGYGIETVKAMIEMGMLKSDGELISEQSIREVIEKR